MRPGASPRRRLAAGIKPGCHGTSRALAGRSAGGWSSIGSNSFGGALFMSPSVPANRVNDRSESWQARGSAPADALMLPGPLFYAKLDR